MMTKEDTRWLIALACLLVLIAGLGIWTLIGAAGLSKQTPYVLFPGSPQRVCDTIRNFSHDPVTAEGIFEDNINQGYSQYHYSDLVHLLVQQRFQYVEEFSAGRAISFVSDISDPKGLAHFRFYLSEVGDPKCEPFYAQMQHDVFSGPRERLNLPRDLCVAVERTSGAMAPYAHQHVETSSHGYKRSTDRLVERTSGKVLAEYSDFLIMQGTNRKPNRTCLDYVTPAEKQKRIESLIHFKSLETGYRLPDIVRPAATTAFLDGRKVGDDSPLRRFYQMPRSQQPVVSRQDQPLPPTRHVNAVLESVTNLDQQIDSVEFGRRFRSPMETMYGAAYSHYCGSQRSCLRIDDGNIAVDAPMPGAQQIDWVWRSGADLMAVSDVKVHSRKEPTTQTFRIYKYRNDGTLLASTAVALPEREWQGHMEKLITNVEETASSYRLHITEFDSKERGNGPYQLISDVVLTVPKEDLSE